MWISGIFTFKITHQQCKLQLYLFRNRQPDHMAVAGSDLYRLTFFVFQCSVRKFMLP